MARFALSALIASLTANCGEAPNATLELSWRLADGRSCADAGAPSVTLSYAGKTGGYRCAEGLTPGFETLTALAREGTLTIRALSADQTELYRGSLDLANAGIAATVTLYATGSR